MLGLFTTSNVQHRAWQLLGIDCITVKRMHGYKIGKKVCYPICQKLTSLSKVTWLNTGRSHTRTGSPGSSTDLFMRQTYG